MIALRFGLHGGPPQTLEEVGRAFGVTRERIRQIENNTLKKLEHLPEAQALRDAVSARRPGRARARRRSPCAAGTKSRQCGHLKPR